MPSLWVISDGTAPAPPTLPPSTAYRAAPLDDLPGAGCRIPWADLEPITGAQAGSRADLSGCRIAGSFSAPAGQVGTDFICYATGRSEFLYRRAGTSAARSGPGAPVYGHAKFTGCQFDAAGQPVKLWDVNRLLDDPVTISDSRMEWANDLYGLVPGADVRGCRLEGHTIYVNDKGEEQHPDGMQANWVPGRMTIVGCWINGAVVPVPVRTDGAAVQVATRVYPAATAVRFNDRATLSTGPGIVYNNTTTGGDGFSLSVLPDYTGESWRQYWWLPKFDANGEPSSGIHMKGNRSVSPHSDHADYQGPDNFYQVMKGQNVHVSPTGVESEFTARALANGFRN